LVERDERLVGWFPGSREREVERLWSVMVETARRLVVWRGDLRFEAPAASGALAANLRQIVRELRADGLVTVTDGGAHALMQRACCGVVASGTATPEAACFGLPD
jgi:lipid-A-disaccharide synthase